MVASLHPNDECTKTLQLIFTLGYFFNSYIRRRYEYVIGKDIRNSVKSTSVSYNSIKLRKSIVNKNQTFFNNVIIFCIPEYQFDLMERLYSFRNWPFTSSVPTSRLVEAGLVHKHGELCVCGWCGIIIDASTLNGERPLDVHRVRNPSCEYIRNYRPNSALDSQQSHEVLLPFPDSTRGQPSDVRQSEAANDVTKDRPAYVFATPAYSPRNPKMATEQARQGSFRFWPHTALVDTGYIAEAGFFFTGNNDTVRCFYCGIGLADWSDEDDPWVEHARFSPDCPFLRQKKPRQFIENIQREWAQTYSPKHPEMSDLQSRMRTFVNSSWPSNMVTQDPQEIAMAGFYYIGEGDTVRCHYCDGGLREWEPGDDPWIEHARWFPFCKYVLRTKGLAYIRICSTVNPNDALAAVRNHCHSNSQASVPLVRYGDDCRRNEKGNPMNSAAAESVRGMGYSEAVIKSAIDEYISKTGRRTFTSRDLMEIIFQKEDKDELRDIIGADNGSSSDDEMQLCK